MSAITKRVVTVPAAIDAQSRDVFRFLTEQLAPSGSRDVPPMLVGYLKRQIEQFDDDKLLTYKARASI